MIVPRPTLSVFKPAGDPHCETISPRSWLVTATLHPPHPRVERVLAWVAPWWATRRAAARRARYQRAAWARIAVAWLTGTIDNQVVGARRLRLRCARPRCRRPCRRRAGAGDPVIVRGARSGPIENRFGPMRLAADWQRTDHGTMPEVPSTEVSRIGSRSAAYDVDGTRCDHEDRNERDHAFQHH